MTNDERDIQRKLRVLQHADKIGNARKACRYFGVGRSSFYRWREAYQKHGEAGLKNVKSIPKNPAKQTSPEIVEKVLYLRRKYHLGPIRMVWYLARYHDIKISDAGVYRHLKRRVASLGYSIFVDVLADQFFDHAAGCEDKNAMTDFRKLLRVGTDTNDRHSVACGFVQRFENIRPLVVSIACFMKTCKE